MNISGISGFCFDHFLVYYISAQNIMLNIEHDIKIRFDDPNFNDQEDTEIWTSVSYSTIF